MRRFWTKYKSLLITYDIMIKLYKNSAVIMFEGEKYSSEASTNYASHTTTVR